MLSCLGCGTDQPWCGLLHLHIQMSQSILGNTVSHSVLAQHLPRNNFDMRSTIWAAEKIKRHLRIPQILNINEHHWPCMTSSEDGTFPGIGDRLTVKTCLTLEICCCSWCNHMYTINPNGSLTCWALLELPQYTQMHYFCNSQIELLLYNPNSPTRKPGRSERVGDRLSHALCYSRNPLWHKSVLYILSIWMINANHEFTSKVIACVIGPEFWLVLH